MEEEKKQDTTQQETQKKIYPRNYGISLKFSTRQQLDDFLIRNDQKIRAFKNDRIGRIFYDDLIRFLIYTNEQHEVEQAYPNACEPQVIEVERPPLPLELQDLERDYLLLLQNPNPNNIIKVSKSVSLILQRIGDLRASATTRQSLTEPDSTKPATDLQMRAESVQEDGRKEVDDKNNQDNNSDYNVV